MQVKNGRTAPSAVTLSCVAFLAPALVNAAQPAYPSKAIRVVTGSSPGGGSDTVARTLSERLSERFRQPVLVDNRAGAAGAIGADIVAKAPADGYTLFAGQSSSLVVLPALQKLQYDTLHDFAPIMQVSTVPFILVVNPQVPARSVAELIQLAKAKPGQLRYATSGIGSAAHLAMEHFKHMAGVDLIHVPYRGSPQAAFDLIGGQVQAAFSNLIPTFPHVKSGRLRALGVSGLRRLAALPDVPTVAESGVPGYEAMQWYGMLAPANVPQPTVARLHRELAAVIELPAVRARLMEEGGDVIGSTPEQFGRILASELAKWTKLVKSAGIRAE